VNWLTGVQDGKLSFPAGIVNFESSCGVCGGWAVAGSAVVTVGGQAAMDACWASSVMAAW
jgi:hypothetical protein